MPKKYALVKNERNPERMLHRKDEILRPFDLEKCPRSSLPTELHDLMKNMVCLYPNSNFLFTAIKSQ